MFCKYCGKEINDEAVVCPFCGCSTGQTTKPKPQPKQSTNEMVDAPSFGFGVLGFFIPIVGLVLFNRWKRTYPQMAKSVGIGALIGGIIMASFYIISLLIDIFNISNAFLNYYCCYIPFL